MVRSNNHRPRFITLRINGLSQYLTTEKSMADMTQLTIVTMSKFIDHKTINTRKSNKAMTEGLTHTHTHTWHSMMSSTLLDKIAMQPHLLMLIWRGRGRNIPHIRITVS